MSKRKAFLLAILLFSFFPLIALAQSADNPTKTRSLERHLPTPEAWQAWCIVFGPLVIVFVMYAFAKLSRVPNKTERKIIANVVIIIATIIGLYFDGQLGNFLPAVAGFVYMIGGIHQSYDKLWQGIPGLNNVIYAIDPWNRSAPQRSSNK